MLFNIDITAHHFVPFAEDIQARIKVPTTPLQTCIEYRNVTVSGILEYTFPIDHYPFRVDDIFVESVNTKLVMSNKIEHDQGVETRKSFSYDNITRKLTFKKAINGSYRIHWIDFSKTNPYQGDWRRISIPNSFLIQGVGNATFPSDRIQNGFRCYPQIDTLPLYGRICYSDDMKAFLYRGSTVDNKIRDTFQFRIYNALGQESDPFCAKIILDN